MNLQTEVQDKGCWEHCVWAYLRVHVCRIGSCALFFKINCLSRSCLCFSCGFHEVVVYSDLCSWGGCLLWSLLVIPVCSNRWVTDWSIFYHFNYAVTVTGSCHLSGCSTDTVASTWRHIGTKRDACHWDHICNCQLTIAYYTPHIHRLPYLYRNADRWLILVRYRSGHWTYKFLTKNFHYLVN